MSDSGDRGDAAGRLNLWLISTALIVIGVVFLDDGWGVLLIVIGVLVAVLFAFFHYVSGVRIGRFQIDLDADRRSEPPRAELGEERARPGKPGERDGDDR